MDNRYQLPSELIVLEKDVEKVFFGHYKKVAGLMGVDFFIDEFEWNIYKGPFAKIISWGTFADPEFEQFIEKYGYGNYLENLWEEFNLKKLGKEPSNPDVREKLLSYFSGALKEIKMKTGDYFSSHVNSKDKFLVVSDNLTLEAITHEAGHVVFNEKNSIKGNRLFAYNIFLDTEVFAIYSSDVALRPIKLEILNLLNNVGIEYLVRFTSKGHEMAYNFYEEIVKRNDNDISQITQYMKEYFNGERKLL